MTMDEFVDATIDIWDIPTESATRIGHPAPFPVDLPRRLIELYTYRGDLVLDPFMGSGSTAVAAVRTERHYIGFDTDRSYVALARRRVSEELALQSAPGEAVRRRVTVPPVRGSAPDDEVGRGQKARLLADQALVACGFVSIERNVAYGDLGVAVDFRARDAQGDLWLFDLAGAYSATRPGLRRPDVLLKALGKASVLHQARRNDADRDDLGPLVLLSTEVPGERTAGGKALRTVTGHDGSDPVYDVLELLDPDSMGRLVAYGAGGHGRG
jgi:site-specific DNA-methyltransferase (adenine-specific)